MNYQISVCLDFYDDLGSAPFDLKALRRLFRLYRSWGATRLDWVDTPLLHLEEIKFRPVASAADNARQTCKNIGAILPAAIRVAHDLGMTFHVVYKPFDHAFNQCFRVAPHGSPLAQQYGCFDTIGGSVLTATSDLVRLRHMQMQRHPDDLPKGLDRRVITAIQLTSDRPARIDAGALNIMVSEDNGQYHRYTKPCTVERRNTREIVISGLWITEPYMALTMPNRARQEQFGHKLAHLVRMFDQSGQELPFTYGLQSRADLIGSLRRRWRIQGHRPHPDVPVTGYNFDTYGQAYRDGFLRTCRWCVDNTHGYLAMAKGKNRYVVGALSPAYQTVQNLWLSEIRECLEAGADAIDMRVENHAWPLEYERYGFEPPVREAYRRRYGDGDMESIKRQALRAEQYTAFYRRAKLLTARYGKTFCVHIGHLIMQRRPGHRYMGMIWEWKRWINEGIADAVTIKDTYPYPPSDKYYNLITRAAHRKGIPVYVCPNFNVISTRRAWRKLLKANFEASVTAGHAGLILYESSRAVKMATDGKPRILFPGLGELLRSCRDSVVLQNDGQKSCGAIAANSKNHSRKNTSMETAAKIHDVASR